MLRNSLLKILPFLLGCLAVFAIIADPQSRWLRLSFFLPFLLGGLAAPVIFMWALIPAALWFHLATVQWHYPNQFVFEFAVIGWLLATSFRQRSWSWMEKSKGDFQFFSRLIAHPFFLLLSFCVIVGALSFAISYGELRAFSPVPLTAKAFMRTASFSVFAWNVEGPLHTLSVVIAYLMYLCFLARLVEDHGKLQVSRRVFADVLLASAIPIFVLSIDLHYRPDYFRSLYTEDISGTFQNGNHLSFFAGLILLLAGWRLASNRNASLPARFYALSIAALAIPPMIFGRGRNAWIGLVVSIAVSALYYFWPRLNKTLRAGAVVAGVAGLAVVVYLLNTTQVLDSERARQVRLGWELFLRHPLQGIGLGNFFLYGGLGYDIHSIYQGVLIELGALGLVVLALGALLFCKAVFWSNSRGSFAYEVRAQLAASLSICAFVVLTGFLDVFLTYRYFLFVLLFWFALELISLPAAAFVRVSYQFWLRRSLSFVLIAGLIVGLSGLVTTPQSRAVVNRSYDSTVLWPELQLRFTWHGPATTVPWRPDKCIRMVVRPLVTEGLGALTVAFLPTRTKIPHGLRLAELVKWQEQLEPKVTTPVFAESWSLTCVCPSERLVQEFSQVCAGESEDCRLYLGMASGGFGSLMGDGANRDHRFLSMGINEPDLLNREEIYSKAWNDRLYCSDVVTLP